MTTETVAASIAEIQGLLRTRLRVGGRTFARQIDKAGRRLPRAIARDARFLAQAETLVQNPKLARMVDPQRIADARARVTDHLRGIDPAVERTDRILRLLALISLQVFVVAGCLVAWLVWRGIV